MVIHVSSISTSGTISSIATGAYYRMYLHNDLRQSDLGSHTSGGWPYTVLTRPGDPAATFDNATVALPAIVRERAITPICLPIATGGNGRLEYTLTPALPAGLSFNLLTRTISGTPTTKAAAATYTLTLTDSDASNPDTDTISFELEVLDNDTELAISGLAPPIYEGQQFTFTVAGSNIPTISS